MLALGRAGIELAPFPSDPTRLRCRLATLPLDIAATLRHHKVGLLGLLRGEGLPDGADGDTEAGFVLIERLAMADELGMPTHPGSPAWLVAVGESIGNDCLTTTTVLSLEHGKSLEFDQTGG